MGTYYYIIYNRYPNDIKESGTVWAFSLKHANKKISKIVGEHFYVLHKI